MFRSAPSHDGSASKYELRPRSVGAFFRSAPSKRSVPPLPALETTHRPRGLSLAFGAAGNSCVGWLCIQARSWSRVLKRARKFTGPQTEVIEVIVRSYRLDSEQFRSAPRTCPSVRWQAERAGRIIPCCLSSSFGSQGGQPP